MAITMTTPQERAWGNLFDVIDRVISVVNSGSSMPSVTLSELQTTHLAGDNFLSQAYCSDVSVAAPVWSDGSHWKLYGSNTIIATDFDAPEQIAPYLISTWTSPVTRINDTRPLSHQKDPRFIINPDFTDDFSTFDNTKWYTLPVESGPQALGRIPARYWGNNVAVENGELTIRMHQVNPAQTDWAADDFDPATLMDKPTPYGGYTSGQVISQVYAHYGYFEIRAKIMKSAGSSAFWLAYPVVTDPQTEIDVFEMGGKGRTPNPNGDGSYLDSANRYNMNYHLFESDASPGREGYNRDVCWTAPFNFADDYHIYGLDWQEDYIRWYVDGVLIHVKENLDQKYPMKVIMDSEAFWGGPSNAETGGWFGFPDNTDLPSKFNIDYIRAWTKNV